MKYEEAGLFDKYHSNLTEAGRLARRLSWLIVIVLVFFSYLSTSFPSQPQEFKIGLLGNLKIPKATLMLVGPFLVSVLYLSWVLMYIYLISVHARLNALLDQKDTGFLKYPSFENLLSTLAREHGSQPLSGRLFILASWGYKLGLHGLPAIGHLYLTWRSFQFTSDIVLRGFLVASFFPLLLGLLVALPDYAKVSAVLAKWAEGTAASHWRKFVFVYFSLFLSIAATMFALANALQKTHVSYSQTVSSLVTSLNPDLGIEVRIHGENVKNVKSILVRLVNDGKMPVTDMRATMMIPDGMLYHVAITLNPTLARAISQLQGSRECVIDIPLLNPGDVMEVTLIAVDMVSDKASVFVRAVGLESAEES